MRYRPDSENRLRLAKRMWGWIPHPTQQRWLLCEAQTKIAACGRRWGKTEAAAIDAATFAITHTGSVQMIVSPTYDQSRLIFNKIEQLIMACHSSKAHAKVLRSPYPKLTLYNSTIMARTADEDGRNLRGHSADRIIIDEAAYVRDSVVSEVITPMLADRNGRLVMISTPFGKNHFFRAFLRGQQEMNGGKQERDRTYVPCSRADLQHASFCFPSWDNPHISRAYIEAQRKEISPRQFSVEYEAQFIDDTSCVFTWEDIEAAATPSPVNRGVTAPSPGGWSEGACHTTPSPGAEGWDNGACIVAGIDWARYSDYTAVIALAVSESGCRVVGIDRFNKMGWESQIARVTEFLRTHRVTAALADSTSIGDPLLEQLRSRLWKSNIDIAVDGYGFTNSSKRDLIEHLALKFAHRSIAIPRDEHLLRELQYFEYELTQSGNVRMNAASGMHDDLVIALALAAWQSRTATFSGSYLSRNGRVAAGGW